MKVTLRYAGIEALRSDITRATGDALTQIKARTQEAAINVHRDARQGAPYRRSFKGGGSVPGGTLKRSLRVRKVDDLSWEVYTNLEYAPFVELGTGRRGAQSAAWAGVPDDVRYKVDWPGQHAQPFLRPAWEAEMPTFLADVEKILRSLEAL
jgi:hypothetical protein